MKPIIYQLLPRLFTNASTANIPGGDIDQNGSGKFNDIDDKIIASLKDLGITHIWLTGIIEHATATDYSAHGIAPDNPHIVKGKAGSPYAIKDYYDVDPDLAVDIDRRMEEFDALCDRIHAAGLKVVIDFVPNHVARQYHSDRLPAGAENLGSRDNSDLFFGRDNNFYYIPRQLFSPNIDLGEGPGAYVEFPAKASGNDCFNAFPGPNDWYETVKLNYGVDYGDGSRHFDPIPDTWMKMLAIMRFWAARKIDGLRCDMAFMVPREFWMWAIPQVKAINPGLIFIAEIYDVALYRDFIANLGFDYLYDKVNLYDTLRGIMCSNVSAARLTSAWQTVDGIQAHMLNFLENHDEQRFGSPQYAGNPALVLPSLVASSMMSTGPMMIYMGQELGEQALESEGFSGADGRTTIFDYWSLSALRRWLADVGGQTSLTAREQWLRRLYRTVLRACNDEAALREGAFFDLMYVNYDNPTVNPHRHYLFLRCQGREVIVAALNFGAEKASMNINIPQHALDILGIQAAVNARATELLSGAAGVKTFSSKVPFETEVEPFGAMVWKLTTRRRPAARTTDSQKNQNKQ